MQLYEWLRQEVLDELAEAGPTGLFDLVWSLRGREDSLTDPERIALAKRVARDIIDSGRAELRRLQIGRAHV